VYHVLRDSHGQLVEKMAGESFQHPTIARASAPAVGATCQLHSSSSSCGLYPPLAALTNQRGVRRRLWA
jgi:hypothetical protein